MLFGKGEAVSLMDLAKAWTVSMLSGSLQLLWANNEIKPFKGTQLAFVTKGADLELTYCGFPTLGKKKQHWLGGGGN